MSPRSVPSAAETGGQLSSDGQLRIRVASASFAVISSFKDHVFNSDAAGWGSIGLFFRLIDELILSSANQSIV